MTQPPDSDAFRVGDRDREQAVAVLQDAVGGGYIDLGEFEERSQTVFAAKTRGELRAVLMDLPTAAALFPPARAVLADGLIGDADTISVDWTTVRRRGRWEVPAHLTITGSMGVADLDLGQAVIPVTGCIIEVRASWSTIKLRLGDAIVARSDGFAGGSMSTLKDKSGPPTVSGGPVVEIRGNAGWTTVVLRR
jgi:hypothetical protein